MGDLFGRGLSLGELFGVRIRLHWTMLLIGLLAFTRGFDPLIALMLLILFLTVLIHELGHCFAARGVGGKADEVLLWPLGGLAFTSGTTRTPTTFVWVALAGPLTHLPLALLMAGLLAWFGHPVTLADLNPLAGDNYPKSALLHNVVYFAFRLQVLLFCLNMLPAYPLDGGQVLFGLLARRLDLPHLGLLCAGLGLLCAAGLYVSGTLLFIPLLLAIESVRLGLDARAGALEHSHLAELYRGPRLATPAPARTESELVPCPRCGQGIHPRAELCVHCDARLVERTP